MNTREMLVDYALELFCTRGYDAVSVQEIVEAAGVTKPTLYHYFGSKFGLLETVMKEKLEPFCRDLQDRAESGRDVNDCLTGIASLYLDCALENRNFYRLYMALSYSGRDSEGYRAVECYLKRISQIVLSVFERASKSLGNMNGRQEQFTIGFLGFLNHYFLYMTMTNQERISDQKKYALVHQFLHGIYS